MILDSTALLAVILNEPGNSLVKSHASRSMMAAVNYSEVLAVAQLKGIPIRATMRFCASFGLAVMNVTPRQAEVAAALMPVTKAAGLSLADRLCLALALERDDDVLTADRVWALVPHGARVTLIR